MEIRKAEFKDAEKLAEIFRNDLGEPDCTKELVLKKMQLLEEGIELLMKEDLILFVKMAML